MGWGWLVGDDQRPEPRWARIVTETFAPAYTVAASVLTIGLLSTDPARAWWQVPLLLLLAAGVPYLFIYGLARLGIWESRHVRPRVQRLVALLGLIVIETLAITVMHLVGAPQLTLRLLAACLAGVIALTLVTPLVRASIHVGVLSVMAGMTAGFSWPGAAALLTLGLVVGVARLRVRDHTPLEVATGLLIGFGGGLVATVLLVL